MTTTKWIVMFDEGNAKKKELLGGKGSGLVSMSQLNLPVPPGFVITTESCKSYFKTNTIPPTLRKQIKEAVGKLEVITNKKFGGTKHPLILSVRSGAVVSMPGMMDTILNVGLNLDTISDTTELSDTSAFIYDCYCRLIKDFACTIHKVQSKQFDAILHNLNEENSLPNENIRNDHAQHQILLKECLQLYKKETGEEFPQDPYDQLIQSVVAVFESWHGQRAVEYRNYNQISHESGTAAIIQMMVFGNTGSDSGTGVVFTRDPSTGQKELFGEYLLNAQGEDLVSGVRTPEKIIGLSAKYPKSYRKLEKICRHLEKYYQDVQDVEFTIENKHLWILQTRTAKRTPLATVKIAVDMAEEGLITTEDAIQRVDPSFIDQVLSPRFGNVSLENALAKGIASSPGAAVGRVALNRDQVNKMISMGEPVIFVRENTSPDDVSVMSVVSGVLTKYGGATSHAAVVARGLGKPCVVGCDALETDSVDGKISINDVTFSQGDFISIDGSSGLVYAGAKKLFNLGLENIPELVTLLKWVDEINTTKVISIARTSAEVSFARNKGVGAIGLCETDWMFNDAQFRDKFRDALLGETDKKRRSSLQKLQELQANEFKKIFQVAGELPVTIQLLSEPLKNFLPVRDTIVIELAELRWSEEWNEKVGQKEQLLQRINSLEGVNPHYGIRGIRYFFTFPFIAEMQIHALFESVCDVAKQNGKKSYPKLRILLPYVVSAREVSIAKDFIQEIASSVMQEKGITISYQIGVLIETPRAVFVAGEIASLVDFLYVGTNGLTEAAFGFASEDGNKFIPAYTKQKIFIDNPLIHFDTSSTGMLVQIAIQNAKNSNPDILIGACGSQLDHQSTIRFFNQFEIDSICTHISRSLVMRLMLANAKIK
jgi:pyruvate, orthophosphate dikinase